MAAGRWLCGVAILAVVSSLAVAGCSSDSGTHFSDAKIIDKLNLKKNDPDNKDVYTVDNDTFCEVDPKLLNDADEVSSASDHNNLIIASKQGNVGVQAIPVFPPDCEQKVQKKLDKLDPKPKGD